MPTNDDDDDTPATKFVKSFKKATGDNTPTPNPSPSPQPTGYADGGPTADDAPFQISQIPGLQNINQGPMPQAGDPGYNSGVAEKDPLGQAILDTAGGIGTGHLMGMMAPDAGAVVGNNTGALDLSALKRLIGNSADDVAGAVVPSPKSSSKIDSFADQLTNQTPPAAPSSGPNADALPTQIKSRAVDMNQRYKQQLVNAKLAALMKNNR